MSGYRIDAGKACMVSDILGEAVSPDVVADYCCSESWPEGQEHQDWLDTAPAAEIADWIRSNPEGWQETLDRYNEASDRRLQALRRARQESNRRSS